MARIISFPKSQSATDSTLTPVASSANAKPATTIQPKTAVLPYSTDASHQPAPVPTIATIKAQIQARDENMRNLLEWSRYNAMTLVSDWRQVWEIGRIHALHMYQKLEQRQAQPDLVHTQMWIADLLARSKSLMDEDIQFWDACEAIYDDEMREVEQLAAEARARVCARIAKLGGPTTIPLCDALTQNDPQEFTREFDWS